ncbi:MAG: hypothetical protein JWM71_972 [Solirubrobacteraceae bacterium]|nr:hypothetical protein [Solirubrobacteraceae bacterium]
MTRRIFLTVLMIAATAVAVPALAALTTRRDAQPAQVSINTAVPAFQVAGLVPGDYMVRCLRVRNEGDAPIKLVDAASITGDLAPYLRIAVERGSGLGDVGPSCEGFVPDGSYALGTKSGGVAPTALSPDADSSWAAHAEKSLRITIALPASTPNAAIAKSGTVTFAFAGTPLAGTSGGGTSGGATGGGGGVATGTTGGIDANGQFISNSKVKKLFKVSRARLLKNGDVVLTMTVPAGGAVRAKVILAGNRYYAHRLYKVVLPPTLHVVLHRRVLGKVAVTSARHKRRRLVARVTTRYRWAHGPHAYVQPEQKLTLVK